MISSIIRKVWQLPLDPKTMKNEGFKSQKYIHIYASPPPQDPYFYMLAFPKTYNTVHPVHLACLEAKYLVPEGFTVLRIFIFNRALPGSSC